MGRLKVLLSKENSIFLWTEVSVTILFIKHHEICMTPSLINSRCPIVPVITFLSPLSWNSGIGQYHLEITAAAEFHFRESDNTHL